MKKFRDQITDLPLILQKPLCQEVFFPKYIQKEIEPQKRLYLNNYDIIFPFYDFFLE